MEPKKPHSEPVAPREGAKPSTGRKPYYKATLSSIEDRELPVVAVVGQPNVGKSTIFNRLTRSRRAIIDATPGMTRDRLYGTIHRDMGSFRLVDTGGIEERSDLIAEMIKGQTHHAILEAEVIVFMVDGRAGLTVPDEEIGQALRMQSKPVILFLNKMEGRSPEQIDPEFYKFGFDILVTGSAAHGEGMENLMIAVENKLEGKWRDPKKAVASPPIRLAIIGRPNAGKSSIVNKMLNEERVMVSDIAGTTRDPIDSYLNYNKQTFCLVDTAGIRKRGKIKGSQESLSVLMATRQVENADVIALLVDASDPEAAQDAAIAGIANKAYKPIIVVVNKWDLVEDKETNTAKKFEERIRRRLKFLETAPFVFVSALTGQRVTRVLDLAVELHERASQRVTTGVLNRFVEDIAKNHRVPRAKGRHFKVFYMTQVEVSPPTFVAVVNTNQPLHFTQERFLVNRIREAFELDGVPIKLVIKPRSGRNADKE
ncbi:ribosome biogenesis GTPase Der [Acanthopleuribacter pedis]|uniref:GTPase Der n=1 Tax=Acanthopleuribacter pedis TaxID=442870 RepID=A0A8J7QMT8_9BACT|nr:ribosome biogenesis GTPase Der [Acanthopleuribacter pedis]MBO1320890.1 ribosome biogenesis GTPase Der [Acanthopleuribacter pedis]